MNSRSAVFSAWILAALYAVFIFTLSSFSEPLLFIGPPEKYPPDWLFHSVEYAFFGMILARAFGISWPERGKIWVWCAAVFLGAFYAVTDEWHQSFVPRRVPDVRDFWFDVLGLSLGAAVIIFMLNAKGKRENNARDKRI